MTESRFRPFRGAMYALYLIVVVTFSLAVTLSVARSVMAMSPRRPSTVDQILTNHECMEAAEALWAELEAERQQLSQRSSSASRVDEQWVVFRGAWVQRHRQTEARCAVESADRAPLRRVFRQLDRTMDLYTTHAVQFAGEMGPTIDRLKTLMAELRASSPSP